MATIPERQQRKVRTPLSLEEKKLRQREAHKRWVARHRDQYRAHMRAMGKRWREKHKEEEAMRKALERILDKEGYMRRNRDHYYNKKQREQMGDWFVATRTCKDCGKRYLAKFTCVTCNRDRAYEMMSGMQLQNFKY